MKIAVLGVGAVGGWFGGSLAQAGHDVTFVARGDTLRVLRDTGLTLNDASPLPVRAVAELAEIDDVDVVLLAVKATGRGGKLQQQRRTKLFQPFPIEDRGWNGVDDQIPMFSVWNRSGQGDGGATHGVSKGQLSRVSGQNAYPRAQSLKT